MTAERTKYTEIGVIPSDWEAKAIGEIGFITSGKRLPKGFLVTDSITPHPYIRVSDMRSGTVALDEIRYVPEAAFSAIRNYRIFKEDIFVSVAGTLGIVGKVPAVLDGANLTENADRITDLKCDQDYLIHVLTSPLIQRTIESIQTVGAQPKLALTRLRQFVVPVPPRPEQKAIAETLEDMDSLIESIERLIAKKRNIKQAAVQQLLTGDRRLPGFTGGWKQIRLGDSAILKARIGWQGLTTAEYRTSGEFLLVTGTEIHEGNVDWSSCFFVSEDRYSQDQNIQVRLEDVLLTKDGTIGKAAFVRELPRPATLNSGVFVIRPIRQAFDPAFFFRVLQSPRFVEFLNQLAAGSTINHLYQKDFVHFTFEIPPTTEEQEAIAAVLDDMDQELGALELRLGKTRAIKQGMMQQLLTGKVRLI